MLVVALVGGCDDEGHPPAAQRSGPNTTESTAESDSTGDCVQPACRNVPLPSSAHAIRLTHAQWENTVRDLLHLPAAPGLSASFPADPAPPGDRFGTSSDSLFVTSALWHEYRRAAEALAELVISTPSTLDALLPAAAKNGDDIKARASAFAEDFLPRAYRRPVTQAEVTAAVALGDRAVASDATSDPFLLRVRWILAAVLQSASFLYRLEAGEGAVVDGRARLGPYELASKLAYSLWGTMPNDTLRGYAASGSLSTPVALASVVKEMVAAPGFDRTLVEFHEQLFRIPAFSGVVRQTALFPKFYPQFGVDAQEDVRRTIRDLDRHEPRHRRRSLRVEGRVGERLARRSLRDRSGLGARSRRGSYHVHTDSRCPVHARASSRTSDGSRCRASRRTPRRSCVACSSRGTRSACLSAVHRPRPPAKIRHRSSRRRIARE